MLSIESKLRVRGFWTKFTRSKEFRRLIELSSNIRSRNAEANRYGATLSARERSNLKNLMTDLKDQCSDIKRKNKKLLKDLIRDAKLNSY